MHELCLHLIGFVENLYRSWKNIKSPINQQKICIFSLIMKATTLMRNTCIEHRFHHPHFLHPGHRMYITNHKLFINVHYFLSKFCLLITFIWLIRNLGEGRGCHICWCFVHCTLWLPKTRNARCLTQSNWLYCSQT